MEYSVLVEAYEKLEKNSKRLKKTEIVAELLKKTPEDLLDKVIYLLQGRVFPKWDERKIGMSSRLMIKAINSSTGVSPEKIEKEWARKGDLGIVVEELIKSKKQMTLTSRKLSVEKVFENIQKLAELEGQGTVSKKINLVTELLTSAEKSEARFIARSVVEDLRIGVQDGVIRDGIVWAYFPRVKGINDKKDLKKTKKVDSLEEIDKLNLKRYELIDVENERLAREIYNYFVKKVEDAYNLTNDFVQVAKAAKEMKLEALSMSISTPVNAMLAIKVENVQEAFKAVGKPAQGEYKLDGFRLQIHKDEDKIKLFTRRLEDVTKQFDEIISVVKSHVKLKRCILDSELVGFDGKRYLPFQSISQRIKRKYDIAKTAKDVPVEINVFDIINKDGKSLMDKSQEERRKILEKSIKEESKKIILVKKKITDDEKEMQDFYDEALSKGTEGLIVKSLNTNYVPGRRVGGWVKLKPILEPLDLVIVSAEYGEGKRAGWLTSYGLACKKGDSYLEIGKASTGLKEKSEGLSFKDMTKILKPLIEEQKGKNVILKPKVIVEIGYEEIQKSSNYRSGFALRFPRLIRLRDDLGLNDCDNLDKVKDLYSQQRGQK